MGYDGGVDEAEWDDANAPIVGILEPLWTSGLWVTVVWSPLLNDERTILRFLERQKVRR